LKHFETLFETNCQTAVYLQGIQRAHVATVRHSLTCWNWGYASLPQNRASAYKLKIKPF